MKFIKLAQLFSNLEGTTKRLEMTDLLSVFFKEITESKSYKDLDKIVYLCKKHDLYLIEDCAQAHFAQFNGKYVGTFGDFGTFSFYPGKNLGAYGDAGAIITNDDNLANKARMFANHGSLVKHQHKIEGINSRMDGIQAAVLSVKLSHIFEWNQKRYQNGTGA